MILAHVVLYVVARADAFWLRYVCIKKIFVSGYNYVDTFDNSCIDDRNIRSISK